MSAVAGKGAVVRRWLGPVLGIPTPVIFIAAAAVATILLWQGGALANVGPSLRRASPIGAAAILLAYACGIAVLGARWHALVRMAGGSPSWTASAEVFLTSVIVNYAAPIGLAVPTRAALTVRDLGLTAGQSAAVVAWEAVLDILALLAISLVWITLGGFAALRTISLDGRALLVVAAGVVVLALVAAAFVRAPALRSRLGPAARRIAAMPPRSPRPALAAVGLTGLFWVIQTGVMAGLLRLFGAVVTPSLVSGVMGLPVLIGMLSPVPGGAGIREALMAAAARLESVPAAPVLLAAVVYRLALFAVTPVIWAAVRLARRRVA